MIFDIINNVNLQFSADSFYAYFLHFETMLEQCCCKEQSLQPLSKENVQTLS
jgi:hypothetical protein